MSASGMSRRLVTVTPVATVPPYASRAAASAFVIDPDPPRATGQPWRWPLARIVYTRLDRVTRHVEHRAQQILGQLIESGGEVTHGALPPLAVGTQAGGGGFDRPI